MPLRMSYYHTSQRLQLVDITCTIASCEVFCLEAHGMPGLYARKIGLYVLYILDMAPPPPPLPPPLGTDESAPFVHPHVYFNMASRVKMATG